MEILRDFPQEESTDIYAKLSSVFIDEAKALAIHDNRNIALKAIETMNTPLYGSVTAFETASEEIAHTVHTQVRNEGMYILFLDRAYERRDEPSRQRAEEQHQLVLRELLPPQREQLLALERKLFRFWDIEQDMRERMRQGLSVSEAELREFILRKSTDVFLYATITRFSTPIPREVVHEFYMHQLLRDLDDDLRDLAEDAEEQMPNPILLQLWQQNAYQFGMTCNQDDLETLAAQTGVLQRHSSFVREYCQSLFTKLPEQYKWMRKCARIPIEF